MRREWVIGFFAVLTVLILVAVLGAPMGAILGGLVLFSASALAMIGSHAVLVRERTALVVCSALHDGVVRVVLGPDRTFILPFLEKVGAVLDTSYRLGQVYVDDILQTEQRPTTLGFSVYIIYQLAPHMITSARLGEILPNLADSVEAIVHRYADYYLRNLLADWHPHQIKNGGRSRLERHLQRLMSEHLAGLGVAIRAVELVIRPAAGLHHVLTVAEQKRIGITLQAEQLKAVLNALTDQSEEAQSLARLELARALGRGGQTWTTLDIASVLSVDPDLAPSSARKQTPLWTEAVEPVQHPEATRSPLIRAGR